MSKYERTVFGRRKMEFEGRDFTIEMRKDGIYVRRKRGRYEWRMSFTTLLNHAKLQPELFYTLDQSDPSESLPGVQEGQLVRGDAGRVSDHLHEGGKPETQAPQVGGNGVDSPAGGTAGPANPALPQASPSPEHQLHGTTIQVASTDQPAMDPGPDRAARVESIQPVAS